MTQQALDNSWRNVVLENVCRDDQIPPFLQPSPPPPPTQIHMGSLSNDEGHAEDYAM